MKFLMMALYHFLIVAMGNEDTDHCRTVYGFLLFQMLDLLPVWCVCNWPAYFCLLLFQTFLNTHKAITGKRSQIKKKNSTLLIRSKCCCFVLAFLLNEAVILADTLPTDSFAQDRSLCTVYTVHPPIFVRGVKQHFQLDFDRSVSSTPKCQM